MQQQRFLIAVLGNVKVLGFSNEVFHTMYIHRPAAISRRHERNSHRDRYPTKHPPSVTMSEAQGSVR